MNKYKVFQTQYYKNFKCIGKECKNNCCCYEWSIKIEQNTYDKYMKFEDEAVQKEFREKIKDNENEDDKSFLAEFKLDEKGRCVFLDDDGLCSIQLRFGFDYLCDVCKSYPRVHRVINNEIEAYLNLSCEAAAELVLFNPKIMRFEDEPFEIEDGYILTGAMDVGKYIENIENKNGFDIFWKLRTASIFILQSRQYKFWFRLIILGMFIEQVEEMIAANEIDRLSAFSDEFIEEVDSGAYAGFENEVPNDYMAKVRYVFKTLSAINTTNDKILNNCFEQMKAGLVSTDENQKEWLGKEHFENIMEKYYYPFFSDKEYIYENYVMNDMLMNGFPFNYNGKENIYNNYILLVIKYSLLKFLLIGMIGYHKENFSKDNIIDAVVALSRRLDHSQQILDLLLKFLEENKSTTLGMLSIFIKD